VPGTDAPAARGLLRVFFAWIGKMSTRPKPVRMLLFANAAPVNAGSVQSIVFAANLLAIGQFVLVALMGIWIFAFWKGHSLTRHIAFRAIPFVLVIALFSLAFFSERFH
jgi:hypothetical protein